MELKQAPRSEPYLYLQIAARIEKQIMNEVRKAGDKLPSVRMLCRELGHNMSTVTQAYYELESTDRLSKPDQDRDIMFAYLQKNVWLYQKPASQRPDQFITRTTLLRAFITIVQIQK